MIYFHVLMIIIYLVLICAYIDMRTPNRRAGEVDYHNYGYYDNEGIDFTPTVKGLFCIALIAHAVVTWVNW